MSRTITLIGLAIDIVGVITLAVPLLKSKEKIRKMSTYTDTGTALGAGTVDRVNDEMEKELSRDNILAIVGLILVVIGFSLQGISLFF